MGLSQTPNKQMSKSLLQDNHEHHMGLKTLGCSFFFPQKNKHDCVRKFWEEPGHLVWDPLLKDINSYKLST